MKKLRLTLLILIILLNSAFATACWNYREIEKLAVVAGVAIDQGTKEQYQMTVEVIKISGGKDTKMTPEIISAEGKTIFDATRNIISLSGKKLYWSHAKIIILSKEIAENSFEKIIDWYNRDSETRPDMYLLISKEASAKEIFDAHREIESIMSLTLADIMENQISLSKAAESNLIKFDIESQLNGASQVIPTISLKQIKEEQVPQVIGAAIIKNQKLAGFLSPDETKDVIFIRNEIKGGLLTGEIQDNNTPVKFTLEIFDNKTKVKPVVNGKNIKININIETKVAIDEIEGTIKFSEDERKRIEEIAAKELKKEIENLIGKLQSEYDADIFEFGAKLREDNFKKWKTVEKNWGDVFKNTKVDVTVKVAIKNSALLSKTLKEGD